MIQSEIILGIDLGGTIHHRVDGQTVPMVDAFRVIRNLKNIVKDIYIVSRVTDEQSLRAYNWFQKFNFFEETTLTPNKIRFCYERTDKGKICRELGVTHFVDDRPEVMVNLESHVVKYLMNPSQSDLEKYPTHKNEMTMVHDWLTVNNLLYLYELQKVKSKLQELEILISKVTTTETLSHIKHIMENPQDYRNFSV